MSASKPILAFAGLGAMGYAMASHLLKSGFPVVAYDVYAPAMHRLAAEGASSAQSPRDAASSAEFLICMVANSQQATRLFFDPEAGAVKALPRDGTILMCSTVAPAYIHKVHLDYARSVLESMSSKLYMVPGGLGAGSKTKIIHQVFAGVNIAMASEAMGLIAAAGINTQHAFEELKNSEGDSFMLRNRVPFMLNPDLPTNSAITIIAKDVVWVNPE
ncbi:MAG: hypothetical protein Q9191_006982 [Dirinaria sp. TL-2023a]